MTELMMKIISWLVTSMALGFIVAWLLSKIIYKKRQSYDKDVLSAIVLERNNMIDKLEKNFRNKNIMFEKVSDDLKSSEKALAEKTSLLTTLQNKLVHVSSNENNSLELKQKNNFLQTKIQKLEQADKKRLKELAGFEEILLLAEERIEDNEKSYKQILKKLDDDIEHLLLEVEDNEKMIKIYQINITDLEEELKLYKADSSAAEFIISKDQFLMIEEQLKKYQKEIESLKHENSELFLKLQNNFLSASLKERTLEDKTIDELQKVNDDSSMVKVFRETYKKITKS